MFGKDSVTEVEDMRYAGETGGPDERPETDGSVDLAEYFDANDPPAWIAALVPQAAVDFVHKVGGSFAKLGRLEVGRGNVCEANASLAIEPTQLMPAKL